MFVGIDVGSRLLHCVALDAGRRVAASSAVPAFDAEQLVDAVAGAEVIAVDAPAEPSELPHRDDPGLSVKFRAARCAEVALGREHGSWVPWVSPAARPAGGWMAAGFAAYEALAPLGVPVLEVFPHGCFRALANGRRLPRKRTPAGRRVRIELITASGIEPSDLPRCSHDELDALVAALVALDYADGRAVRVSCGHDQSEIWLPAVTLRDGV